HWDGGKVGRVGQQCRPCQAVSRSLDPRLSCHPGCTPVHTSSGEACASPASRSPSRLPSPQRRGGSSPWSSIVARASGHARANARSPQRVEGREGVYLGEQLNDLSDENLAWAAQMGVAHIAVNATRGPGTEGIENPDGTWRVEG